MKLKSLLRLSRYLNSIYICQKNSASGSRDPSVPRISVIKDDRISIESDNYEMK